MSASGEKAAVLVDGWVHVYSTEKWDLVRRLAVDRLVDGPAPIVTHVRLYSDSHVVLQTFDATVSVVNFNDGKAVFQRLDADTRVALDNELLVEDKNLVFSRRNRVVLLKRLEGVE